MKIISHLFFSLLILVSGGSSVFGSSLLDAYPNRSHVKNKQISTEKKDSLHAVSIEHINNIKVLLSAEKPNNTLREEIRKRRDSWKLSKSFCRFIPNTNNTIYCKEQLVKQKIQIMERRQIIQHRKSWDITPNYCFKRSAFSNFEYCMNQYYEQQNNCPFQKTSGRRLIVDLENQILYGLKDCQLKIYSQVITGKNSTPTPLGEYKIYHRRGPHYMQKQWFVNKAFYYSGNYAIHDSTWRESPYWDPTTRGVNGSHGCTNTPKHVMERVWEEFEVGDTVQVFARLPEDIAWELKQKVGKRSMELSET